MLRVRLLGELTLEKDGAALPAPTSRRARVLLAWLALHPGLHQRGTLAARFWPEILDTSARASLRTAVWELRKALGPDSDRFVVSTRDRLGLADDVWVDVRAVDALAAAGRADEALELCEGPLLADLDDGWVLDAREEQRARVAKLLAGIADEAETAGDVDRAVELARRRAGLDPLSDEAARHLVRLLALGGDRAAALVAYRRYRDRLREELGIAPSAATRELAARLREAPETAGADTRTGGAPLPPRLAAAAAAATPFVGRETPVARLRSAWDDALAAGTTRLVAVSGEPGIGKTRLAAEFARERAAGGALVLAGRADEDPVIPYQPLVEALRHYAAAFPEELVSLAGPYASELARLVPEAARGLAPRAPAELERAVAFQAIAALFADISAAAPVVLVLDDLQWADGPTVVLLRQLARPTRPARLLVVLAYRATEVGAAHPLAAAVSELSREGVCERVDLAGLGVAELAALTGADAGLARRLHDETAGNPFFAAELMRHLGEGGEGVPSSVSELVAVRLARLTADTGHLLRIAAVAGHELDLPVLEHASALGSAALVDAVEQACEAGILVEGSAGARYAFAHSLVREAIHEGLSRARRARVHAGVAEALETVHGPRLDAYLDRLAHHYAQGGVADKAVEFGLRAGDQAVERLAFERALDAYGAVLALLPDGDPRRRTLAARRAVAVQALAHSAYDRPARASPGSPPG